MTDFEAVRAVSLWGPWATVAILVAALVLAALAGAALRCLGALLEDGGPPSLRMHGTSAQEADSESAIEAIKNPEDLSPEDRGVLCGAQNPSARD